MQSNYIESAKKQFAYYKHLGERTFDQLNEADLFWQHNPESNSIAIMVNHLWGNMMSRWTDFLTADGEKKWRNRDMEFEDVIRTRIDLMTKWEEGWTCLFKALDSVNEDNFDQLIYIRNQGHTIVEAINRQMAHYGYHVGQIVFVGRMIKGAEWHSLSIPKGNSANYNREKFAQAKRKAHFIDDILEENK